MNSRHSPRDTGTRDGFLQEALCSIPQCGQPVHARDFCRNHYDKWRQQIRNEKAKQKLREQPFAKFKNAYRQGCGYWVMFEVLRTNRPLTTDALMRRCKIELVKADKSDYRLDYAFEIMKAKRHASKRGEYQLWQDHKGRWHLMKSNSEDNA